MTYTEEAMRLLTEMGEKHFIYTKELEENKKLGSPADKNESLLKAEKEYLLKMEEFRILTTYVLNNKIDPNSQFSATTIKH